MDAIPGGCHKPAQHGFPAKQCAVELLTNYEPVAVYLNELGRVQGTRTMADRGALKLVGFIFATATLAVMLVAGMVVKGYADGAYTLEASTVEAAR
ncbi:hypothetical protein ACVWZ6_008586 [Bradyrhizobium sp. GM6.1]